MQSLKPNFPFSAVTGQNLFKMALTLVAVNPAIGGVLVSGPRGAAKSTLAKSLADIMPEADSSFVTLPLSVTEEMVVGTLDLQQVLNEKKVDFQSGLLAKAHKGVLYVDEVNLLQDHIVDLLLDVAASGINVVERDGISHKHDAQFVLLGTMNPDEGELRPQLQDRFGLSVELSNEYEISERIEIVQQRERFEQNHSQFVESYAAQQEELKGNIVKARNNLSQVDCPFAMREIIAKKCRDAQVDGLRADIIWHRAAVTHAALEQRLVVTIKDIEAVEELVLSHRRKSKTNVPPKSSGPKPEQQTKPFSRPKSLEDDSSEREPTSGDGDWGKMEPSQQKSATDINFESPFKTVFAKQNKSSNRSTSDTGSNNVRESGSSSENAGARRLASQAMSQSKKVNWLSSFLLNAGEWPLRKLTFYKPKNVQAALNLILIDTSASMLKGDLFAQAKAVVLEISKQAYLSREELSIIGFGNQEVETLLARQRAPKAMKEFLDTIPAAGGTPLREGLERAQQVQRQQYRQNPDMRIKTYIITDGKTRQSFPYINLGREVVLIDIEKSPVKRGKGETISNELNAVYMPLFV